MADLEENDMCETDEEAIRQRHRKEKKSLQGYFVYFVLLQWKAI